MKPLYLLIAILLVIAGTVLVVHLYSRRTSAVPVVHVENGFEFTVHGPMTKSLHCSDLMESARGAAINGLRNFYIPQPARMLKEKYSQWGTGALAARGLTQHSIYNRDMCSMFM